MIRKHIRICLWILAICLLTIHLAACSEASKTTATVSQDKDKSVTSGASSAKSTPTRAADKPADEFSAAFTRLDKNPLHEDIQYMLWLTATSKNSPSDNGSQPSAALLVSLADKFKNLVDSQGVHYTEVSQMLGMELTTECWLKNGRFKKVDNILNEVTLFDGEFYIKYKMDEKSGTRYKKDNTLVKADIIVQSYGMLPNLARSPYQQKEDEKFESFDCSVFFMDIEVMGMKGNTLWVDKNTGMLVKNTQGEGKNGMLTYVSKFETGGFNDEVFTVPDGIKLVDN